MHPSRALLLLGLLLGCEPDPAPAAPAPGGDTDADTDADTDPDAPDLVPASPGVLCATLSVEGAGLQAQGEGYGLVDGGGAPLLLQPTDLGMVLLYDAGRYVVGEGGGLAGADGLRSDISEGEDVYISAGEWLLFAEVGAGTHRLQNRRAGTWLAADGSLVEDVTGAAPLALAEAEGCAPFPELSLDATGTPTKTTFADGTLFGVAESHAHLMSNFSFGGGGLFHGGAYHRYGVEHALPDCTAVHGEEGRKDLFGYSYDRAGGNVDLVALIGELNAGELAEFNHATEGYPIFTEWPDSRQRATHQTQYHRWLERAWLGGLRVLVQHATSDETICKLTVGQGFQESRYDCSDMTAVDRIIDETWQMQDYIDALHGGEGQGWFRIVQTPAEARAVVAEGKLAVILGIETSNLFRCYLTPRAGEPECDADYVDAQLDAYHDRGVRVLFPAHKYGNRFVPGDGSQGFIEAGAFVNSGHWTNKTLDCPGPEYDLPGMYDGGRLTFGGLNEPRDEHISDPPNDMSGFSADPVGTMLPFTARLLEGATEGHWCQNATITPLGEHLLTGMMKRGMIIEVDHLPEWAYVDAYAMLTENDYPAAGTHGRHWNGRIYELGGVATGVGWRCQDPDEPGASTRRVRDRVALIESKGAYPGIVLGFDYNGFAGGVAPRFGEDGCGDDQPNPTVYPFTSFGGDVTFTQPVAGDRVIDFDTEGMVHIGLLPELLHGYALDAQSEQDIEPLYRGAEAYIRMWEKAEARGAVLSGG